MKLLSAFTLLSISLVTLTVAAESNWTQWRGSAGNGLSNATGVPQTFSKDNVVWKTELPGAGQSSPIFWEDTVYLTSATENAHWSSFGVEEAIADGIIVMGDSERMGHLLRFLQVVKMRGTSHSRAKHAIELTPLGVMLIPMLKWGASSDNTSRWGA